MAERIDITTPVGRLVYGSLYDPQTTDFDGKPLTVKSGPNVGQPRVDYSFGIAVPKTQQHWANEPWGGAIWQLAHKAFTNGETQRPDFAWKIIDGDSQIPNRRNRKPCEQEGYPGNWIIRFSGGFAPKVFNSDGSQQIVEKDAVKPGYYVQVFGSVTDNKPSASPGLYFNHTYVALSAYGPEIISGPDVSAAGFGQNVTLPPGASTTPAPGNFNPAPPVPGQTVAPPVPGQTVAPVPSVPVVPVPGQPAAPVAPTVPVVPHTQILTPPAPPAAPARQLTAAANGATYEQLIAAGWTDATLIANGLMLP